MTIRSHTRFADVKDDSRIRAYRNGRADLVWYQTETVRLDVYITNGGRPVAISSGATIKWEAWSGGATGTLHINKSGSIVNAEAGHVRVELTQEESNLAAGSYNFVVKVQADGVALYGVATVVASPNSALVEDADLVEYNQIIITSAMGFSTADGVQTGDKLLILRYP